MIRRVLIALFCLLACDAFAQWPLQQAPFESDLSSPQSRGQGRPNIVFILTDDQRFDAMGFMGHYPFLETPNLDRIRDEGVHLENSFVTLSMCAPARAGFLTGTYPHVNGVNTNVEGREFNPDKTPSFPQVLQANGYKTAFMGKWHMDHSNAPRKGFDHWISFSGQGKYNGNELNIDGVTVKNPGYITDELTQYAVDFIDQNADQPFCLYLSHKAVHQPFTPAQRDKDLYAGAVVPKRDSFFDDLSDKPEWQRVNRGREALYRLRDNDTYSAPAKRIPRAYTPENGAHPNTKDYLRSIAAVDDGIGQLYEILEQKGILDNTAIIFAGDNGYMLGEHGRGDKRVHYNESMRIPLIMRLPGSIPAQSTLKQMVLNIDVGPTILDIAGVPAPEVMQGESILPLFNQALQTPWRDSYLFTYWRDLIPTLPRILSVRTERYVYSTYPDIDDIDELYDLEKDPYEMTNLIHSPEHAPLLQEMQERLEQLKQETGYKKMVPRPRPEPEWGVKDGLLCDVDFNVSDLSAVKDQSSIQNHPTIHSGQLDKGLSGAALSFDGTTTVEFPWNKQVTPEKGSYVIEALVRPTADGVIVAHGNAYRGLMLYFDGGCPGFVLKENGHRLQFLDSQRSFTGQWVHIVAQVKNYHNMMSLWVNGTLVAEEQVMWPLHVIHKGIGGVTLGADPTGEIDPLEISPRKFEGELQRFKIYRQADVSDIVNRAAAWGLSFESGKPRS
tara:strand:- start:47 stop:2224 length:2178 start_codon:yes stop_codon:yes gene_type:complete